MASLSVSATNPSECIPTGWADCRFLKGAFLEVDAAVRSAGVAANDGQHQR